MIQSELHGDMQNPTSCGILNGMNSTEIQKLSSSLKPSLEQREIIVGLMLGDGSLETQNQGRTYRLKVEQSIAHKEYVNWLFNLLENLTQTSPQAKGKFDSRLNRQSQNYWFSTLSLASLRYYGQLFYPKSKKVVPKLIAKMVSPLSLAVWYMDDGSRKSAQHQAMILNTQCFNHQDLERLRTMLNDRFSIITTLREQKEGQQIYIPGNQAERFRSLIGRYVIPSMCYKLS